MENSRQAVGQQAAMATSPQLPSLAPWQSQTHNPAPQGHINPAPQGHILQHSHQNAPIGVENATAARSLTPDSLTLTLGMTLDIM